MATRKLAAVALATLLTLPACASAQYEKQAPMKNIVEIAVDNGSFKTLVTAVQAAGLVETLQSKGPFTVFAPTDAAFDNLPAGTVAALLKDKTKLASILTFHVVPGAVMAGDIVKAGGAKAKTANGEELDIVVRDGSVYVNGAKVVSADIKASNGVIHVIDRVLMPTATAAAR